MKVMYELSKLTFAVQHNPNCPSLFLVRLIGRGEAMLDMKSTQETKDVLGYGLTLRQAAERALKKRQTQTNPYRAVRQLERALPGIANSAPVPRD